MKKPEFPNPRLIREIETKYRIKKVTKPNGKVWYYPQKKFLWFWVDLESSSGGGFDTEYWAQEVVFVDYNKTLKDKVEYLAPDISKTPPSTPKPPPKVV
jgi:hypothetical protein